MQQESKSEDENSEKNDGITEMDIVGTYLSDSASIIIFHKDGTVDYYKYGENEILKNNSWKLRNNKLTVELQDIHSIVKCEVDNTSELNLKSDSALWEDALFYRIDEEQENTTIEECKNILTEQLGVEEELEYKSFELGGIEYRVPSYLEFCEEEDGQTIYTNEDDTFAISFCTTFMGETISNKEIRDAVVSAEASIKSEGDIQVAGETAYYIESSNNGRDGFGENDNVVVVVLQHNGMMDAILAYWQNDNHTEESINDFYGSSGVMVGEKHPHPQYLC